MSIRKLLGDLTSKHNGSDYRVIRSSVPVTIIPEQSPREKIMELFNQYSQHEMVYAARYIGSNKISDPRDTQLVHVALDLVRDAKRSIGGKKRKVEIRMKLGNGISVFDDGETALKLRFPVYKLVYASKAPDNKKVFVFICDISGKERKGYRMYAFKSDEKTAEAVVKTLKEMYYVVHKINRAKKRKKRALEKQKQSLPTPESPFSDSKDESAVRPLSSYLSDHALDDHSGIFPTTFESTPIPNVTAELDSMIEELSLETKCLRPQSANNPFLSPEVSSFSFDDNFGQSVSTSPESKLSNRVSFYDAFSFGSDELALEPTEVGAKNASKLDSTTPDLGASSELGATPSFDDSFLSVARRNIPSDTNGSQGSRHNSFTKLFQRERTGSYSKLEPTDVPISPESELSGTQVNKTGTESLTLANPFSALEVSDSKEKIEEPNSTE